MDWGQYLLMVVSTDKGGLLVVAEPSEEGDEMVTLLLVSPDTPMDSADVLVHLFISLSPSESPANIR